MKPLVGMARTLGFTLLAALGVIPWQLTLGAIVGYEQALSAYALLGACGFGVAVAPNLRAAFLAGLLSAPLAAAALLLADDSSAALLAAAAIAALARAMSYRAQPARALALEVGLLVLSLGAARLFGSASPFGAALGLWAYGLTQSAFFLLLRPEVRAAEPAGDAFEAAHARAITLLERR